MLNAFRTSLFAAAAAALAATAAPQPSAQTQIDKMFSRWTRSTPGCAVGADVRGERIVRAAYGMADLEHDVPIAVDTIFEAGSVSKQFTAAAVLLLARDGRLSLEDRIGRYLPELPEPAAGVTIRQMLQHTAGLRDWGNLAAVAGWPRGTRIHTHAHVLDILSRQRALNFTPGTFWSYSNSGYNLAAILVSRVSGMPFAEYTKTRLFDPVGMRDTSWRDDFTRVVKRRAVGYSEQKGTYAVSMPFENVHGNGGLLTTVDDLLKWNAHLDAPVVGDAALVAELQRRAVFTDGRTHEYALGLYVDTYKGIAEVDHSGGTAGYRAHLGRYPEQRVSVAVLCNAASANPTANVKAIADLFLTGVRPASAPTPTHTLTTAEGDRLAGLYKARERPGASTVVYNQKDGLAVQFIGRLVPLSPTRFAHEVYTYEFDGRGGMRATDEFGRTYNYDRVDAAKPSADRLKEYTGSYVSDEIETTLTVAVDGGRLVIRRRPDSNTALTAVYADGFSSALGWVAFRRDASGRITGLSVSQDRVWDLPFTRQSGGPGISTAAAPRNP